MPPTFRLPPIPAPPANGITNAPVVVLVLVVTPVTMLPVNVDTPDAFNVVNDADAVDTFPITTLLRAPPNTLIFEVVRFVIFAVVAVMLLTPLI